MSEKRYLDSQEVSLLARPTATTVDYYGQIDQTILSDAFHLLCAHHPILRAQVCRSGDRYSFQIPSDRYPKMSIHPLHDSPYVSDIVKQWDVEKSVSHLALISRKESGSVAFYSDHAATDGRSRHALFNQLWKNYRDIITGKARSTDPRYELPASPSGLFDRLTHRKSYVNLGGDISIDRKRDSQVKRHYIRLTADQTRRLVHRARACETSVNALLCGAIMVSQRSQLPLRPNPASMICSVPVDLRRHFDPPIGPTDVTNFIGIRQVNIPIPMHGDPITIGQNIKVRLDELIAKQEAPYELVKQLQSQAQTGANPYFAIAGISNSGIIPLLPTPPGLTLSNWNVLTCHSAPAYPIFATYTYAHKLSIQVVYSNASQIYKQTQQLVGQIFAELERLIH